MRYICKHIIYCIYFTTLLQAEVRPQKELNVDSTIERKILHYSERQRDVFDLTHKIALEFSLPIGIIESTNQSKIKDKFISIELRNVRIRNILDEIVRQDVRYKWKIKDGAIILFPATQANNFIDDLLAVKFESFAVYKGESKIAIRERILNAPLVKAVISRYGMEPVTGQVFGGVGSYCIGRCDFSENYKNLSMQQVLNRIITDSKIYWWAIRKTDKYLSIVM